MDQKQFESIDNLKKTKAICACIMQNQKDMGSMKELHNLIATVPSNFLKIVQPIILPTIYAILKSIAENKLIYNNKEKHVIVNTLKELFDKIIVDKEQLFFNIYGFLLFEIYDVKQHSVINSPEEYKLSVIQCTTSLVKSLSSELITTLYIKENAPKFCQMLYIVLEIAKTERLRTLRISAINCIMAIARVLNDDDFNDLVMRNQIAEMFIFFLPGVASQLKNIALEDEKIGHKIPVIALKAWGRIVALLMQDYNAYDSRIKIEELKISPVNDTATSTTEKFKDKSDMKEYLNNMQRSNAWYKSTDKKLQGIIMEFSKLTSHSHPKVRIELANLSALITENCITTMPSSISKLVEIIIALSEDENDNVSVTTKTILENLSLKFTSDEFRNLLEQLEEGFFGVVTTLPTKFNSIDERAQLVALNLLIGYINIFGKHNLNHVLHSVTHLNRLILSLIHISELERSNVRLLEEYTVQDLDEIPISNYPWKKFHHFQEDLIRQKLEIVCYLLAKYGASRIVSDFLLDIYINDLEHRKEATLILNELVTGIEVNTENMQIIKNIFSTYIDKNYWNLPLNVMIDEFGYEHNLADVRSNIIQVCLLVEGLGKIAFTLKEKFQEFLLKVLYIVLERAGCGQPFIRAAGLGALTNITIACGYSDITQFINKNIDYFCFHVERKLSKSLDNQSVLNVLTVVMKYSTIDVLHSIADLVQEVLILSCDKHKETNANSYLQIFKMFVECWYRWLNIEITLEPLKTKLQKEAEIEDFCVSNIDKNEDFSDKIMNQTAEEMYNEDIKKSQKELEQKLNEPSEVEGEYKKPDSPLEIKLTVTILDRSLHFLPSKDRTRKLLVLEILKSGLEIIKQWEDELLPIVHKIWSPLVGRFKEINDPLIINYSFQLLVTLARLSKDFIRSRTAKDILPSLLTALDKFSTQSYLKDKSSAYRYSQGYKLQVIVLDKLARVLIDLDMLDEHFNLTMDSVFKYLSHKQPVLLQKEAIAFFKTLAFYDLKLVREKVILWENGNNITAEYEGNLSYIRKVLEISC